jgi:hypothetical protein
MFVFFSFFTFKDIVKAGGVMYPESTANNETKKKKNNKKKRNKAILLHLHQKRS